MNIATLLASKSSLREAILLREILGPPRGLQALDATVAVAVLERRLTIHGLLSALSDSAAATEARRLELRL